MTHAIGDRAFRAAVVDSNIVADFIARWLRKRGYMMLQQGEHIREDANRRAGFADSFDLAVVSPLEVKHRPKTMFTSAADFPFPTIFVDDIDKADAVSRMTDYIIVNAPMTHVAWIRARTRKRWKPDKWEDELGRIHDVYACPLSFALFEPIVVAENDR